MLPKPFIFRGMISCGNCGCLVSPEIKKGKYVYYSCTNAKGICHRDYINEKEFLKRKFHITLMKLVFLKKSSEKLPNTSKIFMSLKGSFNQEQKNRLRKEQDQIPRSNKQMYDDRYDGKIDEAFFQKKLKEYKIVNLPFFRRWKAMPRQTKVSMSQRIWS